MSRISLQDVESTQGPLKEAAAMLKEALGVVPNSFRTYGHRPEIAMAFAQLAHAVLGTGSVDPKLKTMVACKVSTTNGCPYCIGHTGGMLHAIGLREDNINDIVQLNADGLSESERLAL